METVGGILYLCHVHYVQSAAEPHGVAGLVLEYVLPLVGRAHVGGRHAGDGARDAEDSADGLDGLPDSVQHVRRGDALAGALHDADGLLAGGVAGGVGEELDALVADATQGVRGFVGFVAHDDTVVGFFTWGTIFFSSLLAGSVGKGVLEGPGRLRLAGLPGAQRRREDERGLGLHAQAVGEVPGLEVLVLEQHALHGGRPGGHGLHAGVPPRQGGLVHALRVLTEGHGAPRVGRHRVVGRGHVAGRHPLADFDVLADLGGLDEAERPPLPLACTTPKDDSPHHTHAVVYFRTQLNAHFYER